MDTKDKTKKLLSPKRQIKKLQADLKNAQLTLELKNKALLDKETKINELRNQHASYDQKIREVVNGHTAAIAAVEKAHSERIHEITDRSQTLSSENIALRNRTSHLITVIQEMARTI